MGQTSSVFGVYPEDWVPLLLSFIISVFVLLGANMPIWISGGWRRYLVIKERKKRWLLNPSIWYNGLMWYLIIVYGVSITLNRMLRILRVDKGDEEKIYKTEIGIILFYLQLGIHGTWAIPHFYWRQPFWSIFVMALATLLSIGVFVILMYVDPIVSGILYGIYVVAQGIFTVCNSYLFVVTYDGAKNPIQNPLLLYLKYGASYPTMLALKNKRKHKKKKLGS